MEAVWETVFWSIKKAANTDVSSVPADLNANAAVPRGFIAVEGMILARGASAVSSDV